MKKASSGSGPRELLVRIVVREPLAGVSFAVQRGKSELLAPSRETEAELVFELPLRIAAKPGGAGLNVLGPYAQGPASDRFLYLNSGTMAGQTQTPWTRRAKIKTAAITQALVDAAAAQGNAMLLVEVHGRAADGGPCCGTVPPLGGGWRVVAADR